MTTNRFKKVLLYVVFNIVCYSFGLDFLGIPPCCGLMFKIEYDYITQKHVLQWLVLLAHTCLSDVQGAPMSKKNWTTLKRTIEWGTQLIPATMAHQTLRDNLRKVNSSMAQRHKYFFTILRLLNLDVVVKILVNLSCSFGSYSRS